MAAVLCQSCSGLCTGLCSSCGKICSFPCTVCSSVCKPICETLKKAFSSHFCFYVAVTLGLNVAPVAFGVQALIYPGCRGSQWLLLNTAFCVAHVIAALYLAGQSKSWSETVKTLCYDPWIAVYILVCIAFFIWLCIGGSWSAQGAMANGDCPDNIASLTMNSLYCGFAFLFFGVFALAISSALSMCMGKGSASSTSQNSAQNSGTYSPPFKTTPV